MSCRDQILDRLPLSESELTALAADPTVTAELLAFARAASKNVALLHDLRAGKPGAVPAPDWSSARGSLESIHESLAGEAAAKLPATIAAELARPLGAPGDVDWSAAVLEHLLGREAAASEAASSLDSRNTRLGDARTAIAPPSHATPGWLWQRIRGDVELLRARPRRARRTWLVRPFASIGIAASLVIGVWAATAVFHPDRTQRSPLAISFQRVDKPFVAGFSTGSILAEVRHGAR